MSHLNSPSHLITRDIVERVQITTVYRALGGPPVRARRGCAFWRKSDGYNVALDDRTNTFHDHARGEGGGVLALIQLARGGTRKEALEWLADFAGIPLQPRTWTKREVQDYYRRRYRAEWETRQLLLWRDRLLAELSIARDTYLKAMHRTRRMVLDRSGDDLPALAVALDAAELYESRVDEFDRALALIRQAPVRTLLTFYRRRQQRAGIPSED